MKNCEEEAICKAFFQSCLHSEQIFSQSSIDINYHIYIFESTIRINRHIFPYLFSDSRRERKREGEGKNIEAEGVPFAPCSFDTRTLNDKCLARFACHSRMHSRCTRVHLLDEIYAVKVWNR